MAVSITSAITINNIQFQYAGNTGVAFNNFSLNIAAGERFGLLGPNGAGKTTLINLMTGVLQPAGGTIRLLGKDINREKKQVSRLFGFVPQFHSFYQELSPEENLEFFGAWAGLSKSIIKKRTTELLEVLGLSHVRHKPVSKFSGGMKNRVNIAIGVIHEPKILFLDEPTNGVDVQTRHAIVNYLKELNAAGTTLVYTSHHLSEAQSLCNQVALIDDGKIIIQDDLKTLLIGHEKDGLEGLFLGLTGKEYRDQ
jgi:ABC-2 type transport system ATP-binding protein